MALTNSQSNSCYIIDYQQNYYRMNDENQLVMVKDKQEADIFSFNEATMKINEGRKSKFYSTISVEEVEYENSRIEDVDWLEYIEDFRKLVSESDAYKNKLSDKLSEVDLKICDIMHYIELYEVSDAEKIYLMNLLQEYRDERRQIKDLYNCLEFFQNSIGTTQNAGKAKEAIKSIKKLDTRKYIPRMLPELFEEGQERRVPKNKAEETERLPMPEESYNEEYINEEKSMEYIRKETSFDGKENDWRQFAKEQIEFYGNINQYITNQYIRMDELDSKIEEILLIMEDANYNVAQAYKVFKLLKEYRNERKTIQTELSYLEPMASCFDCNAMCEAYQYSLDLMDGTLGTTDNVNIEEVIDEQQNQEEMAG